MTTSLSPTSPRTRAGFVDWLRLVASVQMIGGHTIDALLSDAHRHGSLFEVWTWARGLTAPAFFLASGLSFHLATRLDDEARYALSRATVGARRRRVVRSVWLVVLGTLLHLLDGPWMVDVLQCVGVTLLVLDGVVTLAPRRVHVELAAGALAIAAVALAVPLSSLQAEGPLRFVVGYVSRQHGSLFPLVPWAGYLLAGVAIGRFSLARGAATPTGTTASRLAIVGVVALLSSFAVERVLGAPDAETYSAHPAIFAMRLALVLFEASALALLAAGAPLEGWGRVLAGETLTLYVFHLLVLYAEGIGPGRLLAHACSLPASVGAAIVMTALSAAVALGWARLWPPLEARWMPWLRPLRGPTRGA